MNLVPMKIAFFINDKRFERAARGWLAGSPARR